MLPKSDVIYKAYVLRLWSDGHSIPWRAALDCAHTGGRYLFATVADLVAFLESETQIAQPPPLSAEDGEESQT